jgi:hypothetical protein
MVGNTCIEKKRENCPSYPLEHARSYGSINERALRPPGRYEMPEDRSLSTRSNRQRLDGSLSR